MGGEMNYVTVWLCIGAFLVMLEMMALSGILLMLGIGFLATAFISWLVSPGVEVQMVILAASLILTYSIWAKFWKRVSATKTDDEISNDKGLIGKQFHLYTAIEGGAGEIKIQDALYSVYGEDMKAGAIVKILRKEGMGYRVEGA